VGLKVLFLQPNLADLRSGDAMEPLVFAILKSLTPPGIEVVLRDDRVETIPEDEPADLVAITMETFTARRAYHLAAGFRRRGIPVVAGGHHPTLLPDEVLRHVDAVVIGDAEGVWPRLIADARAGRLDRVYRSHEPAPQAGLRPDRSIFAGKTYLPIHLVQSGRGCRFACDFCSVHAFYGSVLNYRPIPEVVAEIADLPGRTVFFVDDNFFADRDRTEALLRALIPLKIHWACQVSIDIAADEALLDLMARSGCCCALVGFESLRRGNLERMNKTSNLGFSDYPAAVARFRQRGIMVYGTFVFGYDEDDPAAFAEATEFAIRGKLCLANFNPLTPTPGTELFRRLAAEGRLLHPRWWLDPDFRYGMATFRPHGMGADDLSEGCFRARTQFNTWASIAGRALDFRANCRNLRNLGLFLSANLTSRREIFRKQGLPLGEAVELEPDYS
jgi:radical SAM superfamily enzyme YgiQ (UPF0313 family)